MNRFASLMVAGLAVAAVPAPVTSEPVSHPQGPLEILVGGAPQRRYLHRGRWYVEALKGREYAIRIRNPYGVRVAVALSVDGLNTIDARETTAAGARKWVLDPYQTVTISGWQTSRTEARRFEFTTEEKSYGEALGKTANLGTISAVFFRERSATAFSRDTDSRQERRRAGEPQPAAPAPAQEAQADAAKRADEEYAATGMGRRTDHAVTQVWLDLEDTPAQTVNIRYEFRPQLVRLGILPAGRVPDPLDRRERGRGFEPGYAPVPPGLR
jgi:hypothetical protein